jgi:pullulanase
MGLLDVDTINKIYVECRKVKPDIIIYGEGWDMPTVMAQNQRASMNNAHLMPNIGFFNDRFRDITKGKTNHEELQVRGYLTGDTNYMDGFKHVFSGSVLPIAYPPLFKTPSQSINYIECHDNNTIYDKLKACCHDEDEQTLFRRIKLNNAAVMFSFGVPFFHMGQEIGLTKFGDHNSYRSTDLINQFRYNTLDERLELYNYFKDLVAMRKELSFLRINDRDVIEKAIEFNYDYSGILRINFVNKDIICPYKDVIIFINPRKETYSTDLNDYYKILFNESGKISSSLYSQHLVVNPLSLVVCVKE